MTRQMTRIAIAGAGAVGGVVAWHLAAAGLDPVVVARPQTAATLARDGLTLTSPDGTRHVAVRATSDPVAAGPADIVILGLKGHDLAAALPLIEPLLGEHTLLVPLLNGVPWWFFQGIGGDHEGRVLGSVDPGGRLMAALPARAVVGAVVYVGASRDGPARITWNGRNRIVLGEPASRGSARLDDLVRLLQSAGIGAEATPDIRAAVWAKLLGNATYNPLSALTGATMGRMADHPPLRALIRAIMVETVAVGRALGVIEAYDVDERLNLSPAMRAFRTSMLQDMDAGRPLELAGIVDAVLELADLTGIDVPVLRTVGALAAERWSQVHGGVSSP